MSGGGDEWSTPEVVRAINRLSTALEKFEEGVEQTFSGLDQKYVPREVFTAEVRRLDMRLDTVLDEREHARSWVRDLLAPVMSGLVVGVILLAFNILAHKPAG